MRTGEPPAAARGQRGGPAHPGARGAVRLPRAARGQRGVHSLRQRRLGVTGEVR